MQVKVITDKRSFQIAEIQNINAVSPHRTQPQCPIFGKCGGCAWQHIDYPQQLLSKRDILASSLWRGAHVNSDLIADAINSPKKYNYRSRVQFKVASTSKSIAIGFFRANSHTVVDAVSGCPIAAETINESIIRLRAILKQCPELTHIKQILIDCGDNDAIAIIQYDGHNQELLTLFFMEQVNQLKPLSGIYIQTNKHESPKQLFGPKYLSYSVPFAGNNDKICTLHYLPGSFSQVNRLQNKTLLAIVIDMIDPQPNMRILDLYCGNGNFSIPLSPLVSNIVGVESFELSILAAQYNCQFNGVKNASYICTDTANYLEHITKTTNEIFDIVLLDPPRTGAAEIVMATCTLKPDKIVYISCDPSTLARDCGLMKNFGYNINKSVPVDMFPQTWHLESVTLLSKACKEL